MLYILKIELISTNGEWTEVNRFEYDYNLRLLTKKKRREIIYDKELKMHFEHNRGFDLSYQIDIKNINLYLSKRLQKASDFIRRLNYIYDWIILTLNTERGRVISIENKNELNSNWQKIRSLLKKDYEGKEVEEHLEEIDSRLKLANQEKIVSHCYHHFGLLFPHIRLQSNNQENKRLIELSPYENEKFEEHIVYSETIDKVRNYNVKGYVLPNSKLKLKKYEGIISIDENKFMPSHAEIEVVYNNDGICNSWRFKLDKYKI